MTHTGRKFWLLDPRPGDFCLEDIAHSLSNQCRFVGQCNEFYSVAQHSALVYRHLVLSSDVGNEKQALFHDAPEAYTGDMSRPLKRILRRIKTIENRIWLAFCKQYDIHPVLSLHVKRVDDLLLATEREHLMPKDGSHWEEIAGIVPLSEIPLPLPPRHAKDLFLRCCRSLGYDITK